MPSRLAVRGTPPLKGCVQDSEETAGQPRESSGGGVCSAGVRRRSTCCCCARLDLVKDAGSGPLVLMAKVQERQRISVFAYVGCTVCIAGALIASLAMHSGPVQVSRGVFFTILFALGERLSIEGKVRGIPRAGSRPRMPLLSAGFLVLMAAAFACSPLTAALIGLVTPVLQRPWRGTLRGAFNSAQTAIYAGAASSAYVGVRHAGGGGAPAMLLSAIAGAAVAITLNTTLVSGVMALERRRSVIAVFRDVAWLAVANLPFSLIALLVAILYKEGGPAAAVFILAPLYVLRSARRGKIELDAAQERTLRAFVRAVELKDPYTSRHSERVAEIAVELHVALGARENSLERRYYGALLHDIGKIAVSGRILAKVGRLTPEEYEVVQRHPGTGAFVVGGVSFLADVVPEILHHHERIDGTGYPCRLSGDAIPFAARVLAVADTFEALTSDRPYRRGLTTGMALAELRRSAGSQLDPEVVEALARLLESGHVFPLLPARSLEKAGMPQLEVAQRA